MAKKIVARKHYSLSVSHCFKQDRLLMKYLPRTYEKKVIQNGTQLHFVCIKSSSNFLCCYAIHAYMQTFNQYMTIKVGIIILYTLFQVKQCVLKFSSVQACILTLSYKLACQGLAFGLWAQGKPKTELLRTSKSG